jgi:CBS-domain-containing membrane protein
MEYLKKMKGVTSSPPRVPLIEMIWSWIGAFAGISVVAYIHYNLFKGTDFVMIIGSFGASAVLIYGAIRSPLAQPRNFIGGHVISALIGVTAYKLLPGQMWLASALAVSTAIVIMHATKTLHPPGGATALIAITGSNQIHDLGYFYVVMPTAIGTVVLLIVALMVNNIAKNRRYPEYWL